LDRFLDGDRDRSGREEALRDVGNVGPVLELSQWRAEDADLTRVERDETEECLEERGLA
jgi:hypothetical protein